MEKENNKFEQDCFEDYIRANAFTEQHGEMVVNMFKALEGIGHYNHCENCNTQSPIPYLEDEIKKLEEELRIAKSDIQSLKNMIVKMCYDRYGE